MDPSMNQKATTLAFFVDPPVPLARRARFPGRSTESSPSKSSAVDPRRGSWVRAFQKRVHRFEEPLIVKGCQFGSSAEVLKFGFPVSLAAGHFLPVSQHAFDSGICRDSPAAFGAAQLGCLSKTS